MASAGERVGRWSSALALTRYAYDPAHVPRHVSASNSVLVDPASEEQIAEAEARLGVDLPPSYAAFLRVTNGAYAGRHLQSCGSPLALTEGAAAPSALFPVERVEWANRSAPALLDVMLDLPEELDYGASTSFDGIAPGSELNYLTLRDPSEVRYGHLLHALHIGGGSDSDEELFLDPLTGDSIGEWQVIAVGAGANCWRYSTFAHLLEQTTAQAGEDLVSDQPPEGGIPPLVEILYGPDPAAVAQRLGDVIGDATHPAWLRSWAFDRLGFLDERQGGDRQSAWMLRFLEDPSFDDMNVLGPLLRRGEQPRDVPTPGAVFLMNRPGDQLALGRFSCAAISALATEVGPDPLAQELRRRALPPYDPPAALLLAEMARSGDLDRPLPLTGDRHRDQTVSADDLMLAGAQLGISATRLGRALVLCGHRSSALAQAEAVLADGDEQQLYLLAEMDDPPSWDALDRAADSSSPVLSWMSLIAASRTRTPLLAPRLRRILEAGATAPRGPAARVAAELQQSEAVAQLLRDRWSEGDLAAVRALARRGDARVSADCIGLLGSTEYQRRLGGAKALRNLLDPSTVPDLLSAFDTRSPDDLVIVIAHALTMMRAPAALDTMQRAAEAHPNPDVARLLTTWARQRT